MLTAHLTHKVAVLRPSRLTSHAFHSSTSRLTPVAVPSSLVTRRRTSFCTQAWRKQVVAAITLAILVAMSALEAQARFFHRTIQTRSIPQCQASKQYPITPRTCSNANRPTLLTNGNCKVVSRRPVLDAVSRSLNHRSSLLTSPMAPHRACHRSQMLSKPHLQPPAKKSQKSQRLDVPSKRRW